MLLSLFRDGDGGFEGWGRGEAKTRIFCPFLLRSFLRRLHSTEASDQGREAKSRDFTRQKLQKYYVHTTMFMNTFCKIVWLLFLFFTFDFSVGHPCSILHRLSSSPIPSFASPTKVRCFVPPPHSLLPPFLPPFLPSWWCSHRHPPSPPPSYTRHRHTLTHSGTERERKEGG